MPYLWTWSPWNRYSNWGARRHGRNDGKLNIPANEQSTNSPYVMQLKQIGDQGIDQFEEEYHRKDARLLADYCRLKREEEVTRESLQESRSELEKSKADEIAAHREYVKHFHVKPITYWVVVGLISLGEFVLNTIVFQILGDDQTKTMLAALGIAVAFPWLGHALGGQFRQGFFEQGKVGRHTVSIIAILVAAMAALLSISYLREKFFEGAGINKILNIEMDPAAVAVAFICLNLLLFVAAAAASYLHHYPEAAGHIVNRNHARRISRNSGKRVKLLEERETQTTAQLAQVSADRVKLYERTARDIGDWRNNTQRLMSVYHEHNLHARGGGQAPVSFKSYPPIDVSKFFENPDVSRVSWDCTGVLIDGASPVRGAAKALEVTHPKSPEAPNPSADPKPDKPESSEMVS